MRIDKRILLGAALSALLSAIAPAGAQTTIRLLSAWPPNTSMIQAGESKFIANLEAASNKEIKVVRNGPETVPPFQQLQPLSTGVFHLMYTTPAYHQADTGMGSAIDGLLTTDPKKVRESGMMDWLNAYYRKKFGVVILALFACPPNQFVLREPLPADGTLKGRKVRTNAAFEGIVRGLGGSPVGLPPSDIYSAMEKGVIDGTAVPQHAAADYKFYEVGKYMTRPGYGHTTLILMANAAAFDALPEKVRKLVQEEAIRMETYGTEEMITITAQQNATMEQKGVKISQFPAEVASKLEQLFAEGTTAVAKKSDGKAVEEMIEFARQKGALKVGNSATQ
jgi:TRAP-type C4-dicarboxylate transport system substrate-binding protein